MWDCGPGLDLAKILVKERRAKKTRSQIASRVKWLLDTD